LQKELEKLYGVSNFRWKKTDHIVKNINYKQATKNAKHVYICVSRQDTDSNGLKLDFTRDSIKSDWVQ